jgi:hypothetical protein
MANPTEAELVRRQIAAMEAVKEAEAVEADALADGAEERLRQHLAKRQSALDALQALEQADYMPTANHTRMRAELMTKAGKAIIAAPVRCRIPVSEQLANEVTELRAKAAQIRSRQVRAHGRAMGYGPKISVGSCPSQKPLSEKTGQNDAVSSSFHRRAHEGGQKGVLRFHVQWSQVGDAAIMVSAQSFQKLCP